MSTLEQALNGITPEEKSQNQTRSNKERLSPEEWKQQKHDEIDAIYKLLDATTSEIATSESKLYAFWISKVNISSIA